MMTFSAASIPAVAGAAAAHCANILLFSFSRKTCPSESGRSYSQIWAILCKGGLYGCWDVLYIFSDFSTNYLVLLVLGIALS